jgi:hypothetical protein
MTKEEKLDILEKKYLKEFGHEMDQWQKDYLMRLLKEEECKDCEDCQDA